MARIRRTDLDRNGQSDGSFRSNQSKILRAKTALLIQFFYLPLLGLIEDHYESFTAAQGPVELVSDNKSQNGSDDFARVTFFHKQVFK